MGGVKMLDEGCGGASKGCGSYFTGSKSIDIQV